MNTDPLKRKPVFGDREQIDAIKAVRTLEEIREGQKQYRVTVDISVCETHDIWADSEEEAKDEALEWIDIDSSNATVTISELP